MTLVLSHSPRCDKIWMLVVELSKRCFPEDLIVRETFDGQQLPSYTQSTRLGRETFGQGGRSHMIPSDSDVRQENGHCWSQALC